MVLIIMNIYLYTAYIHRPTYVEDSTIFLDLYQDLRPFPTHISVSYEGHSGMVRAVAVEARTPGRKPWNAAKRCWEGVARVTFCC